MPSGTAKPKAAAANGQAGLLPRGRRKLEAAQSFQAAPHRVVVSPQSVEVRVWRCDPGGVDYLGEPATEAKQKESRLSVWEVSEGV